MNAPQALHPTDQTLSSYGLGKLDDKKAESVNKHLESCPPCRRRVAELSSDSFLGRLRDAQARPDSHGPVMSSTAGLSLLDGAAGSPQPPPAGTLPPGLADHADYEVIRELGRGGMGVVYLAQNTLMGRREVLKVVSSDLVNRRGVLDRFLVEIRNAAKLHHTNVVTAYSALRLGESLVLAMQYVEGLDLARLVAARGPLPVVQSCNYVHQAAKGLQHAHEHGMVHRDIKPSNLMLAREGNRAVIKVLDFGLAKVRSEEPTDGTLTCEGQMLGTPHFIAPEQISNARGADIRADIYSLGCTLYYLLTGGPPFQGDSLYDILQAHHSMEAMPLNLKRPEVPVELAALVAKMMAKEPQRRFQEPKDVAQALTPFFKKGDVAFQSPSVEISRAGQTGPARPMAGAVPTIDTVPIAQPKEVAKPSAQDTEWKSLIDVGKTDLSRNQTPAVRPMRRPQWLLPAVAVGVLLLGILIAWGVIIRVKTTNGTIELVDLPKDAEVFVDNGKEVAVTWPGGGKPAVITVTAGTHKVQVKKDGFKVSGDEVTVQAGGKEPFTVRLIPLAESPHAKDDPKKSPSGQEVDKLTPSAAGGVASKPPTSPQVPPANSNTNPTVAVDSKGEGAGAAGPAANDPGPPRPIDAALALRGKAEILNGHWLVEGSELMQTDVDGSGGMLFGDLHWTDYDFTVDLMRLGASRDSWVVLTFRSLRNGDHLEFEICGTGEAGCGICAYEGRGERGLTGNDEFRIVARRWYTVRVRVRGDQVVCTIHDDRGKEHVNLTHNCGRHLSGQVGLGTARGSYRFRNIKVTDPDGKSLWEMPPAIKPKSPVVAASDPSSRSITNTIGMKLVLIPDGKFLMGSPEGEGDGNEHPPHEIRITRPYYLGAYEVTQGQYKAVMGGNPSHFKGSDELPVETVSWLDAVRFCNNLSEREGRKSCYRIEGGKVTIAGGDGYRLPTEAEWEYACRAGKTTRFSFSNDENALGQYAWYFANSDRRTHPVGEKRPNASGLYDMHGNVGEWCWDWFDHGYYKQSPVLDPQGPERAASRVFRGGSWNDDARLTRSAFRYRYVPGNQLSSGLGFRVARVQSSP